jgi:hypothetical protein
MKDVSDSWEELRLKILGLGDRSIHKTHYPSLRWRLVERERLRAELERSEAYLAEAQRLSHSGASAYNETAVLYGSEETYRIWGFDPTKGVPTLDRAINSHEGISRAIIRSGNTGPWQRPKVARR